MNLYRGHLLKLLARCNGTVPLVGKEGGEMQQEITNEALRRVWREGKFG